MKDLTIEQILSQNELILAAKEYLSKQLSVIPVGRNKIPLIPWKEFCDRLATPEEVDAWFVKFPDAQLGMVTGRISRVTVVDVEALGGEVEWNKLPQDGTIVKTGGGGRHYWFKYDSSMKNAVRIDGELKHADIRNDHGYVIIPPSISDKGSYEWVRKANLPVFPKNLFKTKNEFLGRGYVANQFKDSVGLNYLLNLYEGVNSGSRNESMVKYIGYVLTQLHPDDWESKAWPIIVNANQKNSPPLGEQELRRSYDSIRQAEKSNSPDRWANESVEKNIKALDKLPVKNNYKLRYTWGTRGLDVAFAIIKRGNFIVLGAKASSGKTTFAFDMAQKNALLGHKVLFLSLEMDEKEVKESVARRSAGITIEEEYDYSIPDHKKKYFEEKIKEINSIGGLFFKGVRRGGGLKWEQILEIIYSYDDLDLVFIDNLDLIEGNKGENDLERQKRIVKKIMGFTSEKQIPIVLIHHYRKTMGKESGNAATLDSLSGSMKIVDGADRIINISRSRDPNAQYPDKYLSVVYLQKGREYPDALKDVYFINGTFVDTPPVINNHDPLEEMTPIAYLQETALMESLEEEHKEQVAQANMFGQRD